MYYNTSYVRVDMEMSSAEKSWLDTEKRCGDWTEEKWNGNEKMGTKMKRNGNEWEDE